MNPRKAGKQSCKGGWGWEGEGLEPTDYKNLIKDAFN